MTTTAVILANVPPNYLGISNSASLIDSRFIRSAMKFCGGSENVVIALNKESNESNEVIHKLPSCIVKYLPETQGALASVGLILDLLPESGNIAIVPTNATISENMTDFVEFMTNANADVGMAVIQSRSPELSYVSEVDGVVVEIHEKEVVGNLACAGIYYFSSKQVLIDCIHWTLINDVRKNGLFYIAPSMNYCITKGLRVIPFPINPEGYERHEYEIG